MNLKHIKDLVIGDEIIITIPSVMNYIGKVSFINKDKMFVFIDGDIEDEDEDGIQFIPNKEGYFKIP